MAKKNVPVWQMLGQPEPPIVNGMWEYGRVYDPTRDGRPTRLANLRSDVRWGLWSWHYWGKKVRTGIAAGRAEDSWSLGLRALSRVVLALVWLTDTLYRRLIPHPEG